MICSAMRMKTDPVYSNQRIGARKSPSMRNPSWISKGMWNPFCMRINIFQIREPEIMFVDDTYTCVYWLISKRKGFPSACIHKLYQNLKIATAWRTYLTPASTYIDPKISYISLCTVKHLYLLHFISRYSLVWSSCEYACYTCMQDKIIEFGFSRI